MPDGAELDNLILAIEAEAAAGLDVEKVARAIEKAGYGEITGDLDQYQEWGGSPREIAAKIAAAYAEGEPTE
jgi:hypothetical protein